MVSGHFRTRTHRTQDISAVLPKFQQDPSATDTSAECVDTIATKKVITEHSKPWINVRLAEQLKQLRILRKKCRNRKSPANIAELTKLQQATYESVRKSEDEWWQSQCQKLEEVNENEKWKIIRRLMNDANHGYVQPIKKTVNGEEIFLFDVVVVFFF